MGAEHGGCVAGACFATFAKKSKGTSIKRVQLKEGIGCSGGACFVPLATIKPQKALKEKKEFEGVKFLEEPTLESADSHFDEMTLALLASEEMKENLVESASVAEEEKIMDTPLPLRLNSMEIIEEEILERTELPSSDYFCEKDKQPIYLNNDVYECV